MSFICISKIVEIGSFSESEFRPKNQRSFKIDAEDTDRAEQFLSLSRNELENEIQRDRQKLSKIDEILACINEFELQAGLE